MITTISVNKPICPYERAVSEYLNKKIMICREQGAVGNLEIWDWSIFIPRKIGELTFYSSLIVDKYRSTGQFTEAELEFILS